MWQKYRYLRCFDSVYYSPISKVMDYTDAMHPITVVYILRFPILKLSPWPWPARTPVHPWGPGVPDHPRPVRGGGHLVTRAGRLSGFASGLAGFLPVASAS